MTYILLIIGFLLLIKGADFFVRGSSNISRYFKIPPVIIGLTIVAFGTSSPEAAVSITAAIQGSEGISIGNIIGSNIINISLIIGITAMIFPLTVHKTTIIKEIPFSILGGIVLLILLADTFLTGSQTNTLSNADGLILLAFFGIFLYYMIEVALKNKNIGQNINNNEIENKEIILKKEILFTILGLTGIIGGGYLVVDSAKTIAINLGMSETLVGLTIVAVGTSLPELTTSVIAAIKKESEIALGNIIGSNIFNIFFVLGLSASIHSLSINSQIFVDLALMVIISLVLLVFSTTHKRKINRFEGTLLLILYFTYLAFILVRT